MGAYQGPIFDGDSHFYEVGDAWSRHLPAAWRKKWLAEHRINSEGNRALYVGDRKVDISEGFFAADGRVPPPGKLHEWLRAQKEGKDNVDMRVPPTADMYSRQARLAKMDEFGVDACILFIGEMVSAISYYDDPRAASVAVHAYNQWMLDDWGFNHQDRIFSTPLLHLADGVEAACKEAEWLVRNGARLVIMPTGPATRGKPAAHPDYDPLWAILNEAGVRVTFHVSEAIYMADHMAVWGEAMQQPRQQASAFFWMFGYGERPVMETMASAIFWNLFGRFPNLKFLSAENGAEWVPNMLVKMDKCRGMVKNGFWPAGQLKQRPSEIFKRHCAVVAYPEDDLRTMIDQSGSADWILMGSDYPHAEGVPAPRDFATEACHNLTGAETRAVMHDNGRRFVLD
jgi:predicted TIM-barrel fold metal-dependent hydrolase